MTLLPADTRAIIELWWSIALRRHGNAQTVLAYLASLPTEQMLGEDRVVMTSHNEIAAATQLTDTPISFSIGKLEQSGILERLYSPRNGPSRYRLFTRHPDGLAEQAVKR